MEAARIPGNKVLGFIIGDVTENYVGWQKDEKGCNVLNFMKAGYIYLRLPKDLKYTSFGEEKDLAARIFDCSDITNIGLYQEFECTRFNTSWADASKGGEKNLWQRNRVVNEEIIVEFRNGGF